MDDKKITEKDVPYIVLESVICRLDRVIKRLWIVILILVFLLLGTNLAWLYYESQFEEVTQTTTVEQSTESGKGDATINDGVHINDESEAEGNGSKED